MRLGLLVAAAGPLLLAGCGESVELANASIAEVASATNAIEKPEEGQWVTRVGLTQFDDGGRRTPVSEQLRAQVGEEVETEACLTGEDARKPLFGALAPTEGADCRFSRFAYRDGTLDATMQCRNQAGERLEVRQQGSYSSTAVDLTSVIRRAAADGKAMGGMTTRVVARRTGDCTKAES